MPTGRITFSDGGSITRTVTLSNGQASFSTNRLLVGTTTWTASYEGDGTFDPASATATTTVGKATAIASVSAPSAPVFGQPVPVTISVAATAATPVRAGGSVDVFDGTTRVGGGTVTNGSVTVTLPALSIGRHVHSAVYGGDDSFLAATSAALPITVGKGSVALQLVPTPNAPVAGQDVTLAATVSAAAPAVGTPTGEIVVQDGSVVVGRVPLVNGAPA